MSEHTVICDAHFYLDDSGSELSREEFLEQNKEWHGAMLCVGGGFEPLRVAVLTADARGVHPADESAAVGIFEDWCRQTHRLDEIGEDDRTDPHYGEYELHMEAIPTVVNEREPA